MIKIRPTKSWLTTTSSSGTVEVLGVIEKTYNCSYQNIHLLLYVCKKPCLNEIKYKHLNIIQHIIKIVSTDMVECIIVKNNFIHSQVQFQADLQAVAVCITINKKTYTVASVYVPPSETRNELAFDRMIKRFSSRYLVLGDFDGHSYLWGANQENELGKAVEHLIDSHNLILLNDSVHTRFDTYHQTSSLLDLSLCHPSIYMDVACEVLSDRLGSDHHPIIITANTSDHPVPERVPKWNFKKQNGTYFKINVLRK